MRTLTGVSVKKTAAGDTVWSLVLVLFAMAWLGLAFTSLHALPAQQVAEDSSAMPNLIISLSSVVLGSAYAGGCGAFLARGRWYRLPKAAMALTGGAVVAVVVAVVSFLVLSRTPTAGITLAVVTALVALIGALPAVSPSRNVMAAALVAVVVLLLFMFLRGLFQNQLLGMITRDPATYRWIGMAGGLVAGLCAGIAGFVTLRRRRGGTKLYGHLVAGALPGALWLVSEVAIRVAAGVLVADATDIDILSDLLMGQTLEANLNGALATLFAGGTTAVLAFGLLLPRPAAAPNRPVGAPRSAADDTEPAAADTGRA